VGLTSWPHGHTRLAGCDASAPRCHGLLGGQLQHARGLQVWLDYVWVNTDAEEPVALARFGER
jgi:hypothetical protein